MFYLCTDQTEEQVITNDGILENTCVCVCGDGGGTGGTPVLRGPSFIVAPDRFLDLVLFEGRAGWSRLGYSSSPIDFIIVGNDCVE